MIRGTQQQERRVDRVNRVMPDERCPNAEAQHHEAHHHAAQSDFNPADEERLIGVSRMKESPVECGHHQGQRPRTRELLQEGNGKGAELHFLRDRRQGTDVKRRYPGHASIEVVGKLGLGRRPRPKPVSRKIEDGLIGKKEKRQPDADDVCHQERPRAQPLPGEVAAQGNLARETLAVDRLGRRNQKKESHPEAQRPENAVPHITRHETRVGIGRLIPELREREPVHVVQEAKNGEGHPKTRSEPHGQAGAADEAQDEHNRHGHRERDP